MATDREPARDYLRRVVGEWQAAPIDDCIIWPYGHLTGGYGQVQALDGRRGSTTAHRASCQLAHGDPPTPQHQAAHKPTCNTPSCVNPAHLYWATPAENQADRVIVGSDCRGSKAPWSRLTPEIVDAIKAMDRAGVKQRVIADLFGITRGHVSQIVTGRRWQYEESA